jgi:hypothetical protein
MGSAAPPASDTPAATATAADDSSTSSAFLDPAFVSQLLGSVDVDQNDPLIQAALAQLQGKGDAKEEDDNKESRKRKGGDEK